MKIDTRIDESTSGLVFKKTTYKLVLIVQFSEEEKAQIIKHGFNKDPKRILVSGIHGRATGSGEIWVSSLMDGRGETFDFEDMVEAKHVQSLAISALKDLKGILTSSSDSGSQSIEL